MAAKKHSRRDFLQGRAAASALGDAVDSRVGKAIGESDESTRGGGYLLRVGRRAMACEFELGLNASRSQNETEQAIAALDVIEELEQQLTVYRPDSEVMEINRTAALRPVRVEPRLFELFQLAGRLHEHTGGAFDITSGPLSQVWGFSRREGRVPTGDELAAARDCVGWEYVVLDRDAQTVYFARPGIEVNFNSIGKGYALDRAACLLGELGVPDFVFHGGRSTIVARGQNAGSTTPGWATGLRHPLRPQQRLAEFWLTDQAFSTSGSGTQYFVHRGKRYGHLLDPRTGMPAEGAFSVSVIAPSGAEADALSTAFYIGGPEVAEEFCRLRTDVSAIFVLPASGGSIEVRGVNLRDDQWRPHYAR